MPNLRCFAPKNGWNIKQQFGLFFFLYVHFFLFFYEEKRKKRTKERENNVYQNSLNCIYLQNFLTASLNENFVRKYNESVISYSGRAAHRLRGYGFSFLGVESLVYCLFAQ